MVNKILTALVSSGIQSSQFLYGNKTGAMFCFLFCFYYMLFILLKASFQLHCIVNTIKQLKCLLWLIWFETWYFLHSAAYIVYVNTNNTQQNN